MVCSYNISLAMVGFHSNIKLKALMLHRALARFTSNTAVKMAVVGEAMKNRKQQQKAW